MHRTARHRRVGTVLVLVSAAALGAATVLAKLAYEDGAGPVTLLAFRYGVASAVLLPPALAAQRRASDPLELWAFLAVSLFYVASAAAFWIALKLGPVTEVAPIAYLYPALVAVIGALAFRESLGAAGAAGVVLGIAGCSLIFGLPAASAESLAAKILALVCAVTAALYYVAAGRTVRRAQSLQGAAMLCLVGVLVFSPLIGATGFEPPASARGWLYVGAIALAGTVLPLVFVLAGVSRIGPTHASLLSLGEPVVAVALALAVLGEEMGALQVAGVVLILGSFVLASVRRPGREGAPPAEV